jgi:hypothetical protein
MRSNRLVQTIIQAVMLVLLTAIVVKLPSGGRPARGEAGGESSAALIDHKAITKAFRTYFEEWNRGEAYNKIESLTLDVSDVSVEGPIAHVEFLISFKWRVHNPDYKVGPLKNAPGLVNNTVEYTEVFTLRRWEKRGWDIEGRRHREETQ